VKASFYGESAGPAPDAGAGSERAISREGTSGARPSVNTAMSAALTLGVWFTVDQDPDTHQLGHLGLGVAAFEVPAELQVEIDLLAALGRVTIPGLSTLIGKPRIEANQLGEPIEQGELIL